MKVSKRDLLLLIGVLLIGAVYVLTMYVFKPMLGNISYAEDTLANTQLRYNVYLSTESNLTNLETQQAAAADEAKTAAEPFLPETAYDNLIWFADRVAQEENVTITSLLFYDPSVEATLPIAVTPAELNYPLDDIAKKVRKALGIEEAVPEEQYIALYAEADTSLYCIRVNIDISGQPYERVLNVLKNIEDYGRQIYPAKVTISSNEQSGAGRVDASLEYCFYSVTKPDDSDPGLEDVERGGDYGKTNPFN